MTRKSIRPRFIFTSFRRRVLPFLALWLATLAPLAASGAPRSCRNALPLPLDHSIHGAATPHDGAAYAVEIPRPGLLVIEAHGTDLPFASPGVRLLNSPCGLHTAPLPLASIAGRLVRRIEMPGTYFVEVAARADTATSFLLTAWLTGETDAEGGWLTDIGSTAGEAPTGSPPLPQEPIDEWDELQGGDGPILTTSTWREIAGTGLLEIAGTPAGAVALLHPWCPWAKRPELLATFTCARRLRLARSGRVTVPRLPAGGSDLLALTMTAPGRLAVGSRGAAALFDHHGNWVAEPADGRTVALPPGRWFLRLEAAVGEEAIHLDVTLD